LPISLIRNTDETITLLARMARFTHHPGFAEGDSAAQ